MPLFWAKAGKLRNVDITSAWQDGTLAIWVPDIRFHDAASMEVLAQVYVFHESYSSSF
jgi:hypothetical protein